ncbi:dipeptidase PepE [Rheinheimera texasensis]|uniref:dipeptidase PepE n=1 Tax=Rheinheimera texasensis TaxID=306205 RepID=UPI0004E18F66|nr:dipeptidase PepE [Rheinheimera texasensis]
MNLLLLSSSRAGDSDYLAPALDLIAAQLAERRDVLFVPYAGVTVSYDDYQQKVQQALQPLGIRVNSIHQYTDAKQALQQAPAVMVGGGNTFALLQRLYQHDLVEELRRLVQQGLPYTSWSAGSNIAGLSIRTTNDMPIVEPPSFQALQLLPFQLNPHYANFAPPGFHGETRDMRLAEFMQLNPQTPVVGLPEGTALRLLGGSLSYLGNTDAALFQQGVKTAIAPYSDLSALLN